MRMASGRAGSGQQREGIDVPRPDDGEVSPVDGGNLTQVEALSHGDDAGIDQSEGQVGARRVVSVVLVRPGVEHAAVDDYQASAVFLANASPTISLARSLVSVCPERPMPMKLNRRRGGNCSVRT